MREPRDVHEAVRRLEDLLRASAAAERRLEALIARLPPGLAKPGLPAARSGPIHEIVRQEAALAGLEAEDLTGPSRQSEVTQARWRAVRRARDELGVSVASIARVLCKDRATVAHALRRTAGGGA